MAVTVIPRSAERTPSIWMDASLSGSLASVLRAIAGPAVGGALLPASAMARVCSVSSELPAALGRWSYLECRLLDAESVDMVCILYRDAARALLHQMRDKQATPLFNRPLWRDAERLMQSWVNGTAAWANAVDHLWLEFDSGSGSSPDPGIFMCFGEHRPADYSIEALRSLMPDVLQALLGDRGGALRAPLDQFLRALPASAHVPSVGAMLQRAVPTLRVCVTKLSDAGLTATLAKSSGPFVEGQATLLAELLPAIAERRDPAPENKASMLHVDIGADGLDPRVSVEHGLSRSPQMRGVLPDARYWAWLVDRGWCSPALHHGLSHWPGLGLAALAGDRRPHRTARLVNHTKLVLNRREPPHFKAYLALAHWPVSTNTLRLTVPE